MLQHERRKASGLQECILIIDNELNSQNKIKNLIKTEQAIFTTSKEDSYEYISFIKYGIIILGNCSLSYIISIKELIQVKTVKIIAVVDDELEAINVMQNVEIFDLVHASHVENMLFPAVKRAFYVNKLEKELENLNMHGRSNSFFITKSTEMLPVLRKIENITDSVLNVLIVGENGTGKAATARMLHKQSQRASQAFIRVNCGYLSTNLLENELFGNPDNLSVNKPSKIELADGGTLFLDGVNDLSINLQNKILEFNRTKTLHQSTRILDVRIISSIQLESSKKEFQHKLLNKFYDLLSEIVINIPSLRERKDDIWLLANMFLQKFNGEYNKNIKGFSNDVYKLLLSHDWYGNIIELKNVINSAVILADSQFISSNDLMLKKDESKAGNKILNLREIREKTERQAVTQALTRVGGNVSQAANLLGISRPTLYTLLEKYSLGKFNV